MDTNALKKFAQDARRQLLAQVGSKLAKVLAAGSAARREFAEAVKELEKEIVRASEDQVVERVAYTWFNRFSAMRFMDANGHTGVKVVSPADGQTRPEILAEAVAGVIDETLPNSVRERVRGLIDGKISSPDAQAEAYALLLVASCNQWHATMPFLFEKIADYSELLMPDDLLSVDSVLTKMRATMTDEACQDVEIIGWLYQFYISEKKDQVFAGLKKNIKITAENIPAATQLFTPHWIVRYLVENSLGRLWLLNRPGSKLSELMDYYIAPEEPETDFLRIARPEDLRICDPAAGSGHMLTYAFDLLHAIYEEEGYDPNEIPALILTHNLYGIEIDDRAGALAAFALVMKAAARLGRRRFLRLGMQPNICVMQDVRFSPAEMLDLSAIVGGDLFTAELRDTMRQFEQAKNFGSLIVPKRANLAEVVRVVQEKDFGGDLLLRDFQARVLTVLQMAKTLSTKYHVVVANPPYMGSGGMNPSLFGHLESEYSSGKGDLMTAFIIRGLLLTAPGGFAASVTLDSWMFLPTYHDLRRNLFANDSLNSMVHIGWNSFPDGHTYNRGTAFVIKVGDRNLAGVFLNLSRLPATKNKEEAFFEANSSGTSRYTKTSSDFGKMPALQVAYWLSPRFEEVFETSTPFSSVAEPRKGMVTADNARFIRQWQEVSFDGAMIGGQSRSDAELSGRKWFPYLKGGSFRKWYGNQEHFVNWKDDGFELLNMKGNGYKTGSTNHNLDYIFQPAITWTTVTSGSNGFRMNHSGYLFDNAASLCAVKDQMDIYSVLAFLNAPVIYAALEALSPTINLSPGAIAQAPYIGIREAEVYAKSCVEIAKWDWDSREESWMFEYFPLIKQFDGRVSLYETWKAYREYCLYMTITLRKHEENNNRIFIEAYGLEGELAPEVELSAITLTCNPDYRYGEAGTATDREARLLYDTLTEFLHYAVGCMFGRYSLDASGMILASQGKGMHDYLLQVPQPSFEPDNDNVIPVLEGEWFADDITERFRKFLRITFGEAKFTQNLAFIEGALGKDIRKWFTRDFFDYHVRRFRKRPFYWLFASPKGTFQALIYMHRYTPDTVNVVLNEYLRPFRHKLEAHRADLEKAGKSPDKTPAQQAKAVKESLTTSAQIEELDKWERDVVFPLATQKISIDLDDGVKANYPKFGSALKAIKGLDAADE